MAVTPEHIFFRQGVAVAYFCYNFLPVLLPKRLRNGRFASEAATWIQKWLKKIRWNF
jgi:hypothetical protein